MFWNNAQSSSHRQAGNLDFCKVAEHELVILTIMKILDAQKLRLVQAGRKLTMPVPISLKDLMKEVERDESTVFWMQPYDGSVTEQFACICVNDKFYALNCKMEKVIFRDVRLTRNFANIESLADGTQKLRIPMRLFHEKIRTSHRVRFVIVAHVY